MRFMKYFAPIVATSLLLFFAAPAQAGLVTYTDQASFLAALNGPYVTDDYNNPGYQPIKTDAQMSNVLGLTTYQSTEFSNLEMVSNGAYGYNGNGEYGYNDSFIMGFNSPRLGGDGVYGVGFYYLNSGGSYIDPDDPTFDALVTFTDQTQEDVQLGVGAGFNSVHYIGLTSDDRISSIYIGADGKPPYQPGSVFIMLDLTVTTPVPEPGIYAIWITGLGLLAWITRRRKGNNYKS